MERTGEDAVLMHYHLMVLDTRSSGEAENILATNYGLFSSSVWEVVC